MKNADLDKEIKRLVHSNRDEKGFVCAVDILLQLNYLTKKRLRRLEIWTN